MVQIAYNMVDPKKGLTEKQINLQKTHTIPLDTLVEVNCDYIETHGVRAFVAEHGRDCDGTPLYSLSLHKSKHLEALRSLGVNEQVIKLAVDGCYGADCLIIIREA